MLIGQIKEPTLIRLALLALCCLAVLIEAALMRAEDFGPGFKAHAVAVDGNAVSVTLGAAVECIGVGRSRRRQF